MRIPEQFASAILANRQYFHELNTEAQKTGGNFVTRPLTLDKEYQFWALDDDALDEFLNGDLLPALYGNEDIDWTTQPQAYLPLLRVLEFERHCAFEGWVAVSNKGLDEMQHIIAAYEGYGLTDEAAALKAVCNAFTSIDEDLMHPDYHDVLGQAYRSVPNRTPDESDRLPQVWAFIRQNPALFAAS